MADDNPDSDSTPRTLLRRVLDTADPRTPRRPRSARAGARRALLETASSRRLSGQTRTIARGRSHGARTDRLVAWCFADSLLADRPIFRPVGTWRNRHLGRC
ncbi:CENPT isoform 18 [Pan troglodytes]|uniref:CENPT isoform 18 n=1 Tax=Pan troglodytes TaxID=9598 RepID=A0A2J8Q4E5_PANTR|nr:CENPT isoform 18 [Pan troglodytes]